MTDCIFCRIISGEIPAKFLHEDEEVVAFRDINPHAPVHLLIVPREHIASLPEMTDSKIISHMVDVANKLARDEGVSESGFRLVINSGRDGGQVVPHIHMHLMGGRRLSDEMR